MQAVYDRQLSARIYGFAKRRVNIGMYITDSQGIVIFDSRGQAEGRDYSRWNDVYLTLRGKYGARSTRMDESDPSSSVLYVAAPIHSGDEIVGVLSVYKPVDSIEPFIELAKRQILRTGIAAGIGLLVLGFIISLWITRPLIRLGQKVRGLKPGERLAAPRMAGPEIKDLALAFEELRQELEGMRTVETYVQSLTHEIKSPLASIRAASELLEEEMPAERRRQFFGNIRTETTRITNIVERLLALAALENRSVLEKVEKISLSELFEELAAGFAAELDLRGIELTIDVPAGLACQGERFLLHQALANLIQNAIDFTPAGGGMRIAARRERDFLILGVHDSGGGIPEYALERIFDRFYSLARPATNKKSSGLGLPFVKEVADLHGGSVRVRNHAAGGTLAELRIPV